MMIGFHMDSEDWYSTKKGSNGIITVKESLKDTGLMENLQGLLDIFGMMSIATKGNRKMVLEMDKVLITTMTDNSTPVAGKMTKEMVMVT